MSVRTRKRGNTYSYIFEAGKTDEGKRKVIEKGGFATKAEAYEAGAEAFVSWKHGNVGITSERILLSDFLGIWSDYKRANIKSTSFNTYESRIQSSIEPYFQNIYIQDITPAMIDQWLLRLSKEGLAKDTVTAAKSVMNMVMKYAVFPCNLLQNNPIEGVPMPKCKGLWKKRITLLTNDDLAALLEKYPFGNPYHIPIMIEYNTGMRVGEVLGLTWDNIDIDGGRISIIQQLSRFSKRSEYTISPPKSTASERTIPIDKRLIDALKDWKLLQEINSEIQGSTYSKNYIARQGHVLSASASFVPHERNIPFVCTHEDGSVVRPNQLYHILRKNGFNNHSFRHTHATLLIENGATTKGAASRLGHKRLTVTEDVYTHVTEKIQIDTLAVFEKSLQTNADKN